MTSPEVVDTRHGRVRGFENDGLLVWRGLRFAAAPVGDLRFRAPAVPASWDGTVSAQDFPAVAWQSVPPPAQPGLADGRPTPPYGEDCLFLSVARPLGPIPPGGLPVLVSIHGGGYSSGNPLLDEDGRALAQHGLVVVSVAYRLGAFGFLRLEDLLGADFAGSGAAGLQDQIQALRWVRDNIAAFGGNPEQVTVYGISAGAKSVANILAQPAGRELLHRAVSSSGGGEHIASIAQSSVVRSRLLAALGLTDGTAGLLTSVAPAELLAAQEQLASGPRAVWLWRPVLDGTVVGTLPIEAIESGAAAGIPLLVGNNGREGATFAMFDRSAAAQSRRVLAELFEQVEVDEILAAYRSDDPGLSDAEVDLAILGTERYGAPTVRLAEAQSRHADVWRYRFDLAAPGVPKALAGGHGMDQAAVWSAHRWRGRTDADAVAGRALNEAIARFSLAGGVPASTLPEWPRYTADDRSTMILDSSPHVEVDPHPAERRAWADRSWASGTWWALDDLAG